MLISGGLGGVMSFYPHSILILSWFYPKLNLDKIWIKFGQDQSSKNLDKIWIKLFYPNFIQIFEELILDKIRIKSRRDKIWIKRHGRVYWDCLLFSSMKRGERVMRLNLLAENLSRTQITFTLFAREVLIYAIHKIHLLCRE